MSNLIVGAPFKSLAGALMLAIFLGPIGLFYGSLVGGIVMSILGLVSVGMVISQHSFLPVATIWLVSIVWSMIEVRWYNRRLWKQILVKSE